MPNSSPSLGGLAAAVTFIENDINAAPALIDTDVDLTDLEGNFNGGTVTVSRLLAEDVVAIRHQGTGAGQIGVSGTNVTYGGTIVGTFAGGVGATLTVTFNAAATSAAVDALVQNLTYANADDTPVASHKLVLNVTDADGATLGPAAVPATFTELTGGANPFNGVDTDLTSKPVFVDLDGDGDLDAVVGNFNGTLRLFENDGGTFAELTGGANPLSSVAVAMQSSPAFVDLDGDGDLDVVVGEYEGTLRAFENEGGVFTELTGTANPFDGVDVGTHSSPTFVDLDGDSDLDAVVGSMDATLRSFENEGGVFTELVGMANPFDGINTYRRSAPTFVDLDGDGDQDLVVGEGRSAPYGGSLHIFENQGGVFTELTGAANPFNGVDAGADAAPAFADLDGDGDMDAVFGDLYGLLHAFENLTPHGHAISVNVTASDDAAVAKNDSAITDEATAIVGGNLFQDNGSGVDVDVDNPLTIAAVNGSAGNVGAPILLASGASLTVLADGTYSYDPNHAFDELTGAGSGAVNTSTTDSFTYTLTNGGTATVTITINGVNSPEDVLRGNAGNNVITGTPDPDTFILDQGGNDTAIGQASGDDFYFGGAFTAADSVNGAGGTDTLHLAGNYLAAPLVLGSTTLTNVEQIVLAAGFSYAITTSEATVAAAANLVVDGSALGASRILDFDGSAETNGHFELAGGAGADRLVGGASSDVLDGGAGADQMTGNGGHDTYFVNTASDQVIEASAAGGTDTVNSSVSFTLGANVERLVLTGTGANSGNGNGLNNNITGNDGNNALNGGGGSDQMSGGLGNDIYFVDSNGDVVTETSAAGGTDLVRSTISYTLTANVENLTLEGSANISGFGNALGNIITGNSGNNGLNGGGGTDSLRGGDGDDVYQVDDAGDLVIEVSATGGNDLVNSSINFLLGGNVENLTLTGSANIDGTGNAQANVITGNSGNNTLNGGAGVDSLRGGDGDDFYLVDDAGDLVIETSPTGGTDTVQSSISFMLGGNIENLTLIGSAANGTGNGLANIISGNTQANVLNGGAGADTMSGGLGNDTYQVDNGGDQIIETTAGGGTDLVQSSVSFVLGQHVDNLTLSGSAAIDGTGNSAANTLNGNGGDNILSGGGGNDVLNGAAGADVLFGGDGLDTLNGSVGNDTLEGDLGNDILTTGSGNDQIYFDTALNGLTNVDTITDFSAAFDVMLLDTSIFSSLSAGTVSAAAFRASSAALDADDRILYDSATGHILYDADGVGGAAAILFATVNPGTTITNADFIGF